MTTIATDGRTIAADSRRCSGWLIVGENSRKIEIGRNEKGEKAIFGAAGNAGMLGPLMAWVDNGRKDDPPKAEGDNAWSLVVIDADGAREIWSAAPYPFPSELPLALGSGREVAFTAMEFGASPREAVEAAKRRDPGTGGPVVVIDIAEALGLDRAPVKIAAE